MSAAIIAAAKKLIMLFFTDKKFQRFVVGIIALAVCILLLPVILLTAVGSSIASAGSEFTVEMTAEQEAKMMQLNADGEIIADTLRSMNMPKEILKAQIIYAAYFQDVPKEGDFFVAYCSHFQNASGNMEQLISSLNSAYGLSIPYDEFMRSYALIRNIHIDRNLFSDTSTKNNIDLAVWALNAYESGWCYVPYTMGEILTEDVLRKVPPNSVTEECKKCLNRRTTDNSRLLRSYLFYNFDSKKFTDTGGVISAISADGWIHVSEESGGMDTMPETIGIALVDGETVGVYVGNGEVIYAKSISDGVVKEHVSKRNWQGWFCVPSVSYPQTAVEFQPYDPNVKNNLDLVQWAIQAYENGWGYVYGTYGNVLTEDVLQSRISVFGHHVTDYLGFIRQNWMGKRTADCVGVRPDRV